MIPLMYNINMKRRGFTIIEVSLFLAISALIFVGIAAGTGVNVARQRYNSAVQSYTEFLRKLYSEVENVENDRSDDRSSRQGYCTIATAATAGGLRQNANAEQAHGRTNCAVYGKIAVFNERLQNSNDDTNEIMVYDIIGDIVDNDHPLPASATNVLSALAAVHAEFLAYEINNAAANTCSIAYAGNSYIYAPDWGSYIETTTKGQRFSGAVMIVRSPAGGNIHTYILNLNSTSYRISDIASSSTSYNCSSIPLSTVKNAHAYLADYLTDSNPKFEDVEANFCLESPDSFAYNGRRRNIRLRADGSNSSAVELVEFDSEDNKCL